MSTKTVLIFCSILFVFAEHLHASDQLPDVDPKSPVICDVMSSFNVTEIEKEMLNKIKHAELVFGLNLMKSLLKADMLHTSNGETGGFSPENVFISPVSIFQTLLLAYIGSEGETEKELAKVIGFDSVDGDVFKRRVDIIRYFLYERSVFDLVAGKADLGYQLIVANKLYFDRQMHLDSCLASILGKSSLETVDFEREAAMAREKINEHVALVTKNKIPELLPSGSIDESTKVALVNAAYFKGDWASMFKEKKTKLGNFHVNNEKITKVKFMHQSGRFNYYQATSIVSHVLELPYAGDDVSMLILLPPFNETALAVTADKITPELLREIVDNLRSGHFLTTTDLSIEIPKFKLSKSYELGEHLSKLGLSSLFHNSQLDGFLDSNYRVQPDAKHVSVNRAIHKSFISLDEKGSEASAATAMFGFRSARPLISTFVANHPFIFIIYDKHSDTILFFGAYQDPTSILDSNADDEKKTLDSSI